MSTRNLANLGSKFNHIRSYSSAAPHHDWFASIKHSFLSAFQSANQQRLNLSKYNQLRLQSIQFPYLKKSLLDHHAISKLIQELNHSQPNQSITLFNDLRSIWGFHPTDQDTIAYLSALVALAQPVPSDVPDHLRLHLLARAQSYQQAIKIARPTQHRSEFELACLIRLSIRDNLGHQVTDQLVGELPITSYQNPSLVHGALILINPQSLQFILDHLNQDLLLEPWIESDLVQKISQDIIHHDFAFLMQVLSKVLKRYSHHQYLNRSLELVKIIMLHLQIPSHHITEISTLADQIHKTTGIEIFRDEPEKLAGQLFDRIPSMTNQPLKFEETLDWYQLSKTRGNGILIGPLVSILEFKSELYNRPDLVDQFIADFQSTARLQPISPSNLLNCLVGFLRLSIYTNRPDLAELTLESIEPGKNKLMLKNQPDSSSLSAEASIELIEGLIQVSERRDQAFRFYEELVVLGQPNFRFFQIFLREYLKLLETPKVTTERAQALSVQRLMKILEDMKKHGIRVNNQIYSNLLDHFSSIVKRNPRNSSTRIQLERIHTLIKLDSNLEPDFHLLHQLFKAFSYNGLYQKAWSIWDKFFSSPIYATTTGSTISESVRRRKRSDYQKISNASFATMFDLAGFESERFGDGRLNFKAIEAWDFLLEEALIGHRSNGQQTTQDSSNSNGGGGHLNKNLFDSWIECLCRSRRIEEAIELIFFNETNTSMIGNNHGNIGEVTDRIEDTNHDTKYLSYAHKLTPTPPSSINQDQEEEVDQLKRGIFKELIDHRTLSILLRFSNREDNLYLATIDFNSAHNHDNNSLSKKENADVNWSSKIHHLVQLHFPHLLPLIKT